MLSPITSKVLSLYETELKKQLGKKFEYHRQEYGVEYFKERSLTQILKVGKLHEYWEKKDENLLIVERDMSGFLSLLKNMSAGVVHISGEMGTGKTMFSWALVEALYEAFSPRQSVISAENESATLPSAIHGALNTIVIRVMAKELIVQKHITEMKNPFVVMGIKDLLREVLKKYVPVETWSTLNTTLDHEVNSILEGSHNNVIKFYLIIDGIDEVSYEEKLRVQEKYSRGLEGVIIFLGRPSASEFMTPPPQYDYNESKERLYFTLKPFTEEQVKKILQTKKKEFSRFLDLTGKTKSNNNWLQKPFYFTALLQTPQQVLTDFELEQELDLLKLLTWLILFREASKVINNLDDERVSELFSELPEPVLIKRWSHLLLGWPTEEDSNTNALRQILEQKELTVSLLRNVIIDFCYLLALENTFGSSIVDEWVKHLTKNTRINVNSLRISPYSVKLPRVKEIIMMTIQSRIGESESRAFLERFLQELSNRLLVWHGGKFKSFFEEKINNYLVTEYLLSLSPLEATGGEKYGQILFVPQFNTAQHNHVEQRLDFFLPLIHNNVSSYKELYFMVRTAVIRYVTNKKVLEKYPFLQEDKKE